MVSNSQETNFSGLITPRLNYGGFNYLELGNRVLCVTLLKSSLQSNTVEAASCCRDFFPATGTGRLISIEGKLGAEK